VESSNTVDSGTLKDALAGWIPRPLASDLVDNFFELRHDATTATLGRSSAGKFVETVVQVFQQLETGKYDVKPNVDAFLRDSENKAATLDDGLRVCAARIARSMYTLRNKRNIAHKGDVDPNIYDLRFLLNGAQWVLAELVRHCEGITMEEAGDLVALVQSPPRTLVEEYGERKLVLAQVTAKDEILMILHSMYPEKGHVSQILESMDRRKAGSVRNAIRDLWKDKLVHGDAKLGYRLTQTGYRRALLAIEHAVENTE